MQRRAPQIVSRCHSLTATALLAVLMATSTVGCRRGESFQEVLPGVRLDRKARAIAVDGAVCLEAGILEYLAVARGGKEYESVFRLHCRPAHLQQALLMAGYEVTQVLPTARGDFDAAPATAPRSRPSGAPQPVGPPSKYWQKKATPPAHIEISIEVKESQGAWVRRPIETYLIDRRTGAPPQRLRWVLTGSYFQRLSPDEPGVFAADETRSIIALWYDPSCLLNLAQDVGNPYRGEALGLELNSSVLPPVDTPVRLILRPSAP